MFSINTSNSLDHSNNLIYSDVFVFKKGFFLQTSTGAGIVIKHHYGKDQNTSLILTAAHVVTGIKYRSINLPSKSEVSIKDYNILVDFRKTNFKIDLCILQTEDLSSYVKSTILSLSKPKVDEEIKVIGYPESKGMYSQNILYGKIIRINSKYIFSNLQSEKGYSGAPYLNKEGEVIGIHSGRSKSKNKELRKGALIYSILDYLQDNNFYEFDKTKMDTDLERVLQDF